MSKARFKWNKGWEKKIDSAQLFRDLGDQIVDDAQRMAPVDTGELRASIQHRIEGGDIDATLIVFSDADHAAAVELGSGRTPAQPYLRPATHKKRSIDGSGS